MQQYDIAAKVLIDACRDDIIRYLLDLSVHQSRLMEPLPQETVSLKRGDYPVLVTDHEGREQLIVLEIQTEWNRTVPLHLLDYRIRYLIKHDVEALTCVLLLRPSGSAADLYEDREVRFRYRLVRIYDMDARTVVSEGPICMLPFVPLMNGGTDCFDQAEAIIYGSERERPVKADMLTSMAIFSGLISAEIPAKLIARRKDIMMESAAYDIIKKEGIEEGMEKGKKETAKNLLVLGVLTDEQIAQATGIPIEELRQLKEDIEGLD